MEISEQKPVDIGAMIEFSLLRAQKIAEILDVSTGQAYRMMQSGELPTIRMGRSLRVPAKALARWIEDQTRSGQR